MNDPLKCKYFFRDLYSEDNQSTTFGNTGQRGFSSLLKLFSRLWSIQAPEVVLWLLADAVWILNSQKLQVQLQAHYYYFSSS